MRAPTKEDIDALVGPATPHFAYQLRARVEQLIMNLPDGNPTKQYGLEQMELLDRLGHASAKAEEGEREPRSRPGWEEVPSSAPAYDPLPPRK
jgi:RecB family exonuclease